MKCKVTFYPAMKEVEVPAGTLLKEAIDLAGLDFDFPCGGRGKCGKCRVRVVKGRMEPSEADKTHLDEKEIADGLRLACAAAVEEDVGVELLEVRGHKILIATTERRIDLDPHVQKHCLKAPPPTLEDQRPDWNRLRAVLEEAGGKDLRISLRALRALPEALRAGGFTCTAVTAGEEVMGIEKGDTTSTLLGIAFDIGTTTVVGYLLDLLTGKVLAVASALNPQTKYGADVISRITYATQEKDGLERLHRAVIEVLNELIEKAASEAKCRKEDVYAASVVGNSCMHHLFLGLNPKHIAFSPYVPVTGMEQVVAAGELGIEINEAGVIYVLPNIAGFVGADTVGVILATEMDKSEEIKLAIDIGTNGEIVLGTKDRLLACSAAAGPAFEGAQISCGMRGTKGAIDHVEFGEEFSYTTIDGERPKGICGSGLIDAVAGMLKVGIIDYRGRMLPPEALAGTPAERFASRVVEQDGGRAFLLAAGDEAADGRPLYITQQDVRELQLAKGAIATGVAVLLDRYGIAPEDISEVLLAGAFGNYLDRHSACAIGLIPSVLENRVRPVGNAAGTGAIAALLSKGEYRRAARIAASVEYVELGSYPRFMELFGASMSFPTAAPAKA